MDGSSFEFNLVILKPILRRKLYIQLVLEPRLRSAAWVSYFLTQLATMESSKVKPKMLTSSGLRASCDKH